MATIYITREYFFLYMTTFDYKQHGVPTIRISEQLSAGKFWNSHLQNVKNCKYFGFWNHKLKLFIICTIYVAMLSVFHAVTLATSDLFRRHFILPFQENFKYRLLNTYFKVLVKFNICSIHFSFKIYFFLHMPIVLFYCKVRL